MTNCQRTTSINTLKIVGDTGSPLGHTAIPLEGGAIISAGLRHHCQYSLVLSEEAEGPRVHSIFRQDYGSEVAVQGVIGFMKT